MCFCMLCVLCLCASLCLYVFTVCKFVYYSLRVYMLCMCVYVCSMCVYICVYMFACMCMCIIHVHVHACVYVCVHVLLTYFSDTAVINTAHKDFPGLGHIPYNNLLEGGVSRGRGKIV